MASIVIFLKVLIANMILKEQITTNMHSLLRKMFFIPCDNWKTLCLIKYNPYPEVLFNSHVFVFFETTDLKQGLEREKEIPEIFVRK